MRVFTPCDAPYLPYKNDVRVFLAGGISNCPDWQAEMTALIKRRFVDLDDLVIFNPRRPEYKDDEGVARAQITWERQHLHQSHIMLFWFPCETLCPITLFEYGYWLATYEQNMMPRLVVGCHQMYQRKLDLQVQTELSSKGIIVQTHWEEMLIDLLDQYAYIRNVLASS